MKRLIALLGLILCVACQPSIPVPEVCPSPGAIQRSFDLYRVMGEPEMIYVEPDSGQGTNVRLPPDMIISSICTYTHDEDGDWIYFSNTTVTGTQYGWLQLGINVRLIQ